jgi:hypothetical protein
MTCAADHPDIAVVVWDAAQRKLHLFHINLVEVILVLSTLSLLGLIFPPTGGFATSTCLKELI